MVGSKMFEQDLDLEEMQAYAIVFFLKNIDSLKSFIKEMDESFGQTDLVFVLKLFVLNRNLAFDMIGFMKRQSEKAEQYVLSKNNKEISKEEQRIAIKNWVNKNAAAYRKEIIFKQINCIEIMQDKIIPIIKKALRED